MDWRELSRPKAQWLIPSDRTKNGTENLLPLSAAVLAELDALAEGETWPKRGLVLTTNGETPISGFSKAKRALDAAMLKLAQADDEGAEIIPWRLHDLRRSMATHMQALRMVKNYLHCLKNALKKKLLIRRLLLGIPLMFLPLQNEIPKILNLQHALNYLWQAWNWQMVLPN